MNVVCTASASRKNGLTGLILAVATACGSARPPTVQTFVRTATIQEGEAPFFAAPWPDDRRLSPEGTVRTQHFPNPGATGGFRETLEGADGLLRGWGLSSPIFLPFFGPIDATSLASDPFERDGSVFLLNIDPESPERGKRHPIDFHFFPEATLFLPANVLAVRPVPGFPLHPKTRYAVVVTTAVRDNSARPLGVDSSFTAELVDGAFWAPLREELQREGFSLNRVAGATLFTTQPLVDDLLVLRDFVQASPLPEQLIPDLHLVTGRDPNEVFWLFEGHYRAPHMQHGALPYVVSGGSFEYDATGTPVVGFQESMRVAVVVPKGLPPPNGFPVVLYSHGTGGTFESIVNPNQGVATRLAAQGVAGFGIDQILAGPRDGGTGQSCFFQAVQYCFTNYVNPIAGRNNLRQAALDNVFLRRVAQALTIPSAMHPEGQSVSFDHRRFAFMGHSQGGQTGAIFAAIAPDLAGAVISGAGGPLTGAMMLRKVPNAQATLEGRFLLNISGRESIDWYHPAVALLQTINESIDPVAYAPYWVKTPIGQPKNVYMTSGLDDEFIPADTSDFLAAAAGLPRLGPIVRSSPVLDWTGLAAVTAPVENNLTSVTAVYRQLDGQDHYAIFNDARAYNQWPVFLRTMLVDDVARVPADQ